MRKRTFSENYVEQISVLKNLYEVQIQEIEFLKSQLNDKDIIINDLKLYIKNIESNTNTAEICYICGSLSLYNKLRICSVCNKKICITC